MPSPWYRKWFANACQSNKKNRTIRKVKPWLYASLFLENLEDRLAPATLHWLGGAAVGSPTAWSDAGNWQESVTPNNGDNLVFDTSVGTINSFTSNNDLTGLTV